MMRDKKKENNRKNIPKINAAEILESISDGFYAIDRDWRIAYVNERAAANIGLKPGDLIGLNLWERFPDIVGTQNENYYRRAMAEGKI
jgi:PAS domain S-box-containing protein